MNAPAVQHVGIVRDDRYMEHKTGLVHPEHPNRLKAIYRMLDQEFPFGLMRIPAEPATMDQLELVHTPAYIEMVLKTADQTFTHLAPDTPASDKSYLAAWLAVGGCIQALDYLMAGRCRSAFALVRPPGHHALPDRAAGFCIFNNLAITARQALKAYGLKRILIVDWDIHHGNGVQQIFYDEREVFYFSSHYVPTFPQTGGWEEVGRGPGLGYTVNVPLMKNQGDEDVLHCYREILGPIFELYRPELVLVAAGFDAHERDPMSRTSMTERGFGWLTRLVLSLADGIGGVPVLLALEGGYDMAGLVGSTREVLQSLLMPFSPPPLPEPDTGPGAELVEMAQRVHRPYGIWVHD